MHYLLLPLADPRWRRWRAGVAPFVLAALTLGVWIGLEWLALRSGWLPDADTPAAERALIVLGFTRLALLLPLCWGVSRVLLGLPLGAQSSAARRFRWGVLARSLAVGLPLMALSLLADWLLMARQWAPQAMPWAFLLTLALLLPLQCAAEEFAFRGLLMQGLASVFTRAAEAHTAPSPTAIGIALIGSAALFAWVHGAQSPPLLAARVGIGLTLGWLMWRTQGLEAAIALHIANNAVTLIGALAAGTLAQDLTISDTSWPRALLTVAANALVALLIASALRRRGLQA